jgi:hypothetical protein
MNMKKQPISTPLLSGLTPHRNRPAISDAAMSDGANNDKAQAARTSNEKGKQHAVV